ncbi:MAG: group 1 truncated hemoglobin [Deltaproteobacteria bacterium]|nr:group 1 truncated hemoglobin [Deltaproteobacteria bacterium]
MRIRTMLMITVAGLGLATTACGNKTKPADTTTTTAIGDGDKKLFDRLGGMDAIKAVVDDFVANVVADARINAFFKGVDAVAFKKQLVDQICNATGGPCEYKGKDMKTAHTGMKITDEHFTALVEDLVTTLDKFKVPEKEKGELLGALGGMKPEIVGQ